MITYLEISLFDSPAQTLVNTVNTVGVMGKGIALTFKKLYPEMFKEYHKLCDENKFTVGSLYIYRTFNKIIVNFPTKKHWNNPSKISYIDSGLKKFINFYQNYGISSVSFPQLGCGNGELDWDRQVQPLMENYLKDLPIPVYIHLYPQDPDFIPERLDENYAKQVLLERQRVSANKLWQDIYNLAHGKSGKSFQMALFGPNIDVQEEVILFILQNNEIKTIYRDDLEELWNVLRMRGVIGENDIPDSIRESGATEWLYDLLERLEYIRPVQIRKRGNIENGRGLKYVAQPIQSQSEIVDVLV
jgi:O-acetyl-ADP-ribose deacetylase (regulator of RNase III)